jgi:hypothetical protein
MMIPSPETKATCDANGNWKTVQVVRVRSGNGWIEITVTTPGGRDARKEAA